MLRDFAVGRILNQFRSREASKHHPQEVSMVQVNNAAILIAVVVNFVLG
jgi:hypothetical protein